VDELVTFVSEKPYIVTVNPDFLELEETEQTKEIRIIDIPVKIEENAVKIQSVAFIKADPKTVEVNEADAVIGIGKGLGETSHLKVIENLADLLCAPIGGTRIARDKGWIPFSRQIGVSGKKISPKLYLALGISGSNHHVEGIRDSKIIVAVNTDRNAPITKVSDLVLIGDLHEVAQQLTEILRTRNTESEVSRK
jgi:electron transfer flavoprotein alpha subunit